MQPTNTTSNLIDFPSLQQVTIGADPWTADQAIQDFEEDPELLSDKVSVLISMLLRVRARAKARNVTIEENVREYLYASFRAFGLQKAATAIQHNDLVTAAHEWSLV